MAKKVVSQLDRLQERLGLLKKATDKKKKSKKRAKKVEKRKANKRKHRKQRVVKATLKKAKRQKLKTRKLNKQKVKERKLEKHKMRNVDIRKRKKSLKAKRAARKSARGEVKGKEIKLPDETKAIRELIERGPIEEDVDNEIETPEPEPAEKTEEKETEQAKPDEAKPEDMEIDEIVSEPVPEPVPELEPEPEPEPGPESKQKKSKEKEAKERAPEKPKKRSKFSLPFKIKLNLLGRKRKKDDDEKPDKKDLLLKKVIEGKGEGDKELPKDMIKQLIVADVMSTDPITVHENDKLSYVVRLFSSRKISGAPVVSDHNMTGIITKSDIIKVIGVKDLLNIDTTGLGKLDDYKVSDVMRKKVYFVTKYTKISVAADVMNKNDVNLLPVVDDKKRIIGIVSRGDIVRVVSKELLTKMVQERRHIADKMTRIETDIDSVLDLIEKEGSINMLKVGERLNVSEDRVEDWAKILEKEDLIEIFYPAFGSPVLRKKLKKEAEPFEEDES